MKIAQVSHNGNVIVGVIEGEYVYLVEGVSCMEDVIFIYPKIKVSNSSLSLDSVNWLPVVSRPSKIIAIGLNYKDHIDESKGKLPKNPIVFAKYPNSLLGHKEFITWDKRLTNKVDYEAELAVIVGKTGKFIKKDEAGSYIFGYTCANDVSARDLQFSDGQWTRGKSLDTFCPLGPFIVTKDEISDPQSLQIKALLNGNVMQDSNTSMMIFSVYEIISFISHYMTLYLGDVILTGTPSGVGAFREPSIYLKDGDEITVSISSIGELVNYCRVMGD